MLPDDKSQKNRIKAPEEQVTIMPTMIDDSEGYTEQKRDMSAIIPKDLMQGNTESGQLLNSLDYNLKSDGSISLGTINVDGEITMNPNAAIPEQIDIEERKKIAQKNKGIFKKEKKKKNNKAAQKFQNYTALGALIVIIGLAGFYYWYKHHPTAKDFKPLNVVVELGDALPKRTEAYVKPGAGEVDELLYALDLSQVKPEEVGEYEFTVTYNGIKKTGIVTIQDTTPPELVTRELKITEDKPEYTAAQFVESCHDYSGCNYSFQQVETDSNYTTPGTHIVHVTATDAYQNTTTKKASLIIEAAGQLVRYKKYTAYNFNAGYKTEETYDITFIEYEKYVAIFKGTHTIIYEYSDDDKFKAAIQTYSGEPQYTISESEKKITFVESIQQVGSNYSKYEDVDAYLKKERFNVFN